MNCPICNKKLSETNIYSNNSIIEYKCLFNHYILRLNNITNNISAEVIFFNKYTTIQKLTQSKEYEIIFYNPKSYLFEQKLSFSIEKRNALTTKQFIEKIKTLITFI